MSKIKKCSRCGLEKEISEFYINARGWAGWCKECGRARSREQSAQGYFRRHRERTSARKQRIRYTYEEKMSSAMWRNCKRRSARDGRELTITRDEILALVQAFCNSNFFQTDPKSPFQPSIDRINSKEGYTASNVRIVWLIENYARNTFTDADVLEFCRRKLGIE